MVSGVLHEEAVDEHGAGQGPGGGRDLPLPPGAAQVTARLPPLREGGGGAFGLPGLPRPLRGQQARAAGHTVSLLPPPL